jgi:hypothetical protein
VHEGERILGFANGQPGKHALSIPIFEFLLGGIGGWFSCLILDDDALMLGGPIALLLGTSCHFSCTRVNDIHCEYKTTV